MQDHAVLGRQQHHAVGVGDLLVERLHHRRRMLVEEAVDLERLVQRGLGHGREIGPVARRQTELQRALMGLADQGVTLGDFGRVRPAVREPPGGQFGPERFHHLCLLWQLAPSTGCH